MNDLSDNIYHRIGNNNCFVKDNLLNNYIHMLDNDPLWEKEEISYKIYLKDIRRTQKRYGVKALNEMEEKKLVRLKCNGDSNAFDKLVISQLSLVIHIARKYQNLGLTLNDLINEGNLGLLEAIRKIEPNYWFSVSSYTKVYIKTHIWNAIDKYRLQIHYPINIQQNMRKIQKSINQLKLQNGYQPSYEDIAESCDLEFDIICQTVANYNQEVSKEGLVDFFDDSYIFDDDINSVLTPDFLSTTKETDVDFYMKSLRKELDRALRQLYDREREILKMFFGIDQKEMTLEEIAAVFDLTRERVRQIKEKAIRRLKGQKSKLLKQFLG